MLRTLASRWKKEKLDVFEAKIEESEQLLRDCVMFIVSLLHTTVAELPHWMASGCAVSLFLVN